MPCSHLVRPCQEQSPAVLASFTDPRDQELQAEWERFYLVFGGHIFFQTLRTAVRLGLFDLLNEKPGLTRAEIAESLEIEEQPARHVLLGCTAVGFLRKDGDGYYLSKLASRVLVKTSPKRLVAYVELEHQAMYKAMPWMLDSVREYRNVGLKEFEGDEPTIYQRLAHYPEIEQIFQDAMEELSVYANADMAHSVDFSSMRHVIDVGGGNGTNLIELCKNWPHLRGTVFDSPTVCEIARRNIQQAGFADRIAVVPGECFTDPLPTDGDCLMFCHFFTIWSEEQDRRLLQKSYEALPPGGKVLVFNMMQHDDETGPLTAAIGSPYFLTLATGKGMLYTWREYETWMQDAGFSDVTRQTLNMDHGVVIGAKQ